MPTTTTTALALRGISKRFGAVNALTDIDLDVAAGEVVAIVGDNGAGKSTLVKVLSGVHPPDAGTISFDGTPVTDREPERRDRARHRDRVPGPRAVREPQRRREPVPRPGAASAHGWTRSRWRCGPGGCSASCRRSIPSVRTPIAALSGGQRQTVAIARSLLGDPRIIILDEPTAALGVAQTAEVLDLIERLRERGLGVIMVSHNMDDVRAVADRIVVLRLGRNNGTFPADASTETIVSAITGADDNAVTRRRARRRSEGVDHA